MTAIPPGRDPFVITVRAEVQIEVLVYAPDSDDAHNMLHGELGEQLNARVREFFKDPDSPFITYDHDDRPALYTDIHGSVDERAYPPLEPYFPTLVRDPDDDAFDIDATTIPDFPPTDDKENH